MQYSEGSVNVTLDSPTVTGVGTAWSGTINVGDCFMVSGVLVPYTVASVVDDDEITLSAPWAGATTTGVSYFITRGFTLNYKFPEIYGGDRNWPALYTTALRMIDAKLKDLEDRIEALEP